MTPARSIFGAPRLRALLRATSRTFYLSLYCAPPRRRETLALAYLTARAADTLADEGELDAGERRRALALLIEQLRDPTRSSAAPPLPCPAALERDQASLVAALPGLIERFARLGDPHRKATLRVLITLLDGMARELRPGRRAALDTPREVLAHAYRAAGCVGRYWTELLQLERAFAPARRRRLTRLGIRLGLGLQLVNLIRDAPADARRGRVRLVIAAGSQGDADLETWLRVAAQYLEAGLDYAASLPYSSLRDRFAVLLPAFLGLATLGRLRAQRAQYRRGERIKIPRREVRRWLLVSVLVTLCPPLRRRASARLLEVRS